MVVSLPMGEERRSCGCRSSYAGEVVEGLSRGDSVDVRTIGDADCVGRSGERTSGRRYRTRQGEAQADYSDRLVAGSVQVLAQVVGGRSLRDSAGRSSFAPLVLAPHVYVYMSIACSF